MTRSSCPTTARPLAACALTLVVCFAGGVDAVCAAGAVTISVEKRQGKEVVIVRGLPPKLLVEHPEGKDGWTDLLRVMVDRQDGGDLPPVSGDHRVENGALVFLPRHAFRPGIPYRATYRGGDAPTIEHYFALPDRPPTDPTSVSAVYPSADQLPENLLKFYIHFSAPMRQGVAYDHVRVLGADGTPVADPFVNVGQELWDPTGKRLTLIFDPGRIKHGLLPREQLGPVLEAGKEYALEIDNSWKDAAGRPMAHVFTKKFQVIAPDTDPPDPQKWRISSPTAGMIGPLMIEFPEPMDHALAQNSIQVLGLNGKPLEGTVSLSRHQRLWEFTPSAVWQSGSYKVIVDGRFEDLAAHSVGRPFEVRVGPATETVTAIDSVLLHFTVE